MKKRVYNPEKMKEYRRAWRRRNPEKMRSIYLDKERDRRYPRKPAVFDRTGLDDPMVDPAWIPYGWTQKYVDGRWIVSHPKASYVGGSVYTYDDLCRMYELGYRCVFNTFAKVAPECA